MSDTIRAWLIDDCDYVAATTADEARVWYLEETGVDAEELTEASLEMVMTTCEWPDDPCGENMTFAEAIKRRADGGGSFPAILASDE